MKSLLGRVGFVVTKYATAATFLGVSMSVGGMITRDGPDPGDGGSRGVDPGSHVGNYCRDDVSGLASQQPGDPDSRHAPKSRPTNGRDANIVE
jgi:hypothetical protein